MTPPLAHETTHAQRGATLDANAFLGAYPFRHLPHPNAEVLVRVLAREGIAGAWTGHLPTVFHRDPGPGNRALVAAVGPHRELLHPIPVVRPDWPRWRDELAWAAGEGAPAVRAYPPQWGIGPDEPRMIELAAACAEKGLTLVLTVKFEDLRQRHPLDVAGDLTAAAIRSIARSGSGARLLVTSAGRDLIEEVHWGLTRAERALVWWDISWIWGPPEDHLATLLRNVGADRFVFGTAWPLRLTQVARANLALLPDDLRPAPLTDPATWRAGG